MNFLFLNFYFYFIVNFTLKISKFIYDCFDHNNGYKIVSKLWKQNPAIILQDEKSISRWFWHKQHLQSLHYRMFFFFFSYLGVQSGVIDVE